PEPVVGVVVGGVEAGAGAEAGGDDLGAPAAAAGRAGPGGVGGPRGFFGAGRLTGGAGPGGAPLGGRFGGAEQAVAVGAALRGHMRPVVRGELDAEGARLWRLVAPGPVGAFEAAEGGELALGLGRQAVAVGCDATQPFAVGDGVVPAGADD